MPWTRGRLIAVEGLAGGRRVALRDALAQDMRRYGLPVRAIDQPEGLDLGSRLLHTLTSSPEPVGPTCRLFTQLAVHAQLAATHILPELALGRWVLVQSYLDAFVAETGARGELPAKDLATLANTAAQGATPDLTLYLETGELSDGRGVHERWRRMAEVSAPRIVVVPYADLPTMRRVAFGHVRQYLIRAGAV
jgi:thymidylate kinase